MVNSCVRVYYRQPVLYVRPVPKPGKCYFPAQGLGLR